MVAIAFMAWLGIASPVLAQSVATQTYEYAVIKYDGPDRIQLILPDSTEFIRVFQTGAKLPKNIHDEEFCVNWAVNHLAKSGWEVVNLHATRVMLKRPVK